MSAGGGREQLQQLSQELQAIDEEIDAVEQEIADARQEQTEIDEAIEAIQRLDDEAPAQVPIGGGAYLRAEVQNVDEIVVSLGGDYAAERDQSGAIETLETKRDTLDDRVAELQEEQAELQEESDELETQAQQMQQQLQQQQMQQMQQTRNDE